MDLTPSAPGGLWPWLSHFPEWPRPPRPATNTQETATRLAHELVRPGGGDPTCGGDQGAASAGVLQPQEALRAGRPGLFPAAKSTGSLQPQEPQND